MKKLLVLFISILVLTSCKKEKQTISSEKNKEIEHILNTDFKDKITANKVQLVDVRTPEEYQKGHLENATLINYRTENFVKNALAKLDKSKPVYVYCHSGHRSANSAILLQKEGFKVYDMKGGISGWKSSGYKTVTTEEKTLEKTSEDEKEKTLAEKSSTQNTTTTTVKETIINKSNKIAEQVKETTAEIKKPIENKVTQPITNLKEKITKEVAKPTETVIKEKTIQNKPLKPALIRINTPDFKTKTEGKNVQLVDVRTPKEYKDGHIPKAKNINIYDDDFIQQASVLDKSKPVYVYCRSGVRSMKAANKLKNAGYKVYNLNDGIKGWKKEGNKVE